MRQSNRDGGRTIMNCRSPGPILPAPLRQSVQKEGEEEGAPLCPTKSSCSNSPSSMYVSVVIPR